MRLFEYEAEDIFEAAGIPVPRRGVADSIEEVRALAEKFGYPILLKAQVLVGGRGLAGGIKTASTHEELEKFSAELFGSHIKGLAVRKILVTEKIDISKELYVGVTVDGFSGKPILVASTEGGVHIEETARTSPDKISGCPNLSCRPGLMSSYGFTECLRNLKRSLRR